jgi:hypothetical protein
MRAQGDRESSEETGGSGDHKESLVLRLIEIRRLQQG